MFYGMNPEVAGQLGECTVLDYSKVPYEVTSLEYCFDGWLGDDILVAFPVVIVSQRLRSALEAARLSGLSFSDATITKSDLFREVQGDLQLPAFSWLKPNGKAFVDDFALSPNSDFSIVVSEKTLAILEQYAMSHCEFEVLEPSSS